MSDGEVSIFGKYFRFRLGLVLAPVFLVRLYGCSYDLSTTSRLDSSTLYLYSRMDSEVFEWFLSPNFELREDQGDYEDDAHIQPDYRKIGKLGNFPNTLKLLPNNYLPVNS